MMTKRRKKFFRREFILEKLIEIGESTAENLLNSVIELSALLLPYHQSYRQMKRMIDAGPKRYVHIDLKTKLAFWALLSKLKKEKLITSSKEKSWRVTKAGREYLKIKSPTPPWSHLYKNVPPTKEKDIQLVIFDIPENKRIKRDWLRFQLAGFNYRLIQKSAFIGLTPLPENFIDDLEKYDILPYVHIFSIKKKGTIDKFLEKLGDTDSIEK